MAKPTFEGDDSLTQPAPPLRQLSPEETAQRVDAAHAAGVIDEQGANAVRALRGCLQDRAAVERYYRLLSTDELLDALRDLPPGSGRRTAALVALRTRGGNRS